MGATCSTDKHVKHNTQRVLKRSKSSTTSKVSLEIYLVSKPGNDANHIDMSHPGSYKDIKRCIRQGNLQEAKRLLREAITDESKNFIYHYLLGKILNEELCFGEAVIHLQRAFELNPSDEQTISVLIAAYTGDHEYEEALKVLKRGLEVAPCSRELHLTAALLYELLENYEESNEAYTTILLNHKTVDRNFISCKIAINCLKLKKEDEAQKHFKNVKLADPRHSALCCFQIYKAFFEGDYASAMQQCQIYNTMHFEEANAIRSELWFIWTLSYKYRTLNATSVDELDYLSKRRSGTITPYAIVDQERRHKMIFNRLRTTTFERLKTSTSQVPKNRIKRANTEVKELEDLNRSELKPRFKEMFRANYFSRCLVITCKEQPYNYKIVLYALDWMLKEDPDSLILILKENMAKLSKDFRRYKAPRELLEGISQKIHMHLDVKEEINSIIQEIYCDNPVN